jgi:hypothetical protein
MDIKPKKLDIDKYTSYIKGITTNRIAFSCTWNPKLNAMKLVAAK